MVSATDSSSGQSSLGASLVATSQIHSANFATTPAHISLHSDQFKADVSRLQYRVRQIALPLKLALLAV
jgi:hypothetical protein